MVTPSPSDTIKILDSNAKPKTFAKQVRESDFIILDISQQQVNIDEAEAVICALKQADQSKDETLTSKPHNNLQKLPIPGNKEKNQTTLVVVSSPMVWSNTIPKGDRTPFDDTQSNCRIPLPKYQRLK
jgi:hypothetical protein